MRCASKFFSHLTMISNFFIVIINEFLTNPESVTILKLFFFFTHGQIFVKVFVCYFFAVLILFKACVLYFYQIFIFNQMIALPKLWKMFFISSNKAFFVVEIFKFLYLHLPLFFSLSARTLFRIYTFQILTTLKKYPHKPHTFFYKPAKTHITPFHTKNNF